MPTITNIITRIPGDFGSLSVKWDCEIDEQNREVSKIHHAEIEMFDKIGVDITNKLRADRQLRELVENGVLDAVEYHSIRELKEGCHV